MVIAPSGGGKEKSHPWNKKSAIKEGEPLENLGYWECQGPEDPAQPQLSQCLRHSVFSVPLQQKAGLSSPGLGSQSS